MGRAMKFTFPANLSSRLSPETARELEILVEVLETDTTIVPTRPGLEATVQIALSPRSDGYLFVFLDARERPLQMVPVRDLASYLEGYRACVMHLGSQGEVSLSAFETLDMGKRIMHNEAAEALREQLAPLLSLDREAARRLFSLLYTLSQAATTL